MSTAGEGYVAINSEGNKTLILIVDMQTRECGARIYTRHADLSGVPSVAYAEDAQAVVRLKDRMWRRVWRRVWGWRKCGEISKAIDLRVEAGGSLYWEAARDYVCRMSYIVR